MDKFYFFKVTLIYFDDITETLFITPDQSEADEQGIPFSEQELRNNAEFKAFVKRHKVDVVDVKYVEYAVETDNKTVILGNDITAESFATLENHDELDVVDKNEFPLILKQTKKASGGSSIFHIICIAVAAIIVVGLLVYNAPKGGDLQDTSTSSDISSEISDNSDSSESTSNSSESSAESTSTESTSETSSSSTSDSSSSSSASESSEISSISSESSSTNSSVSSEETHSLTESSLEDIESESTSSEIEIVSDEIL